MQDTTYAEYKKLLESFSKIRLFKMNGLEMQKLLAVPLEGVSQGNVRKYVRYCFRRVLRSAFFSNYSVKVKGKGNIILLFSNCYSDRLDYKARMETLWGYLEDCGLVSYKNKSHRLNLAAFIRLFYFPIWWLQIGHRVKGEDKFFIVTSLLEALEERDSIVKAIGNISICGIIVYCDAHITDNLLVQHYKVKNVPTATLQHAYIAEIDDNSHEYLPATLVEGFVSDFFVLQGEEAKFEAIKCGISSKRLFVAGGLEGKISQCFLRPKRGIFGVPLCVKEMKKHNEELISIANKIAEHYNFKYIIRLHPSITEADITDFIDKKYMMRIEDKLETIDEYANKIDFSITGKSTMFSQLLQRNHPTFQFIDSEGKGIYPSLNWGRFSTIAQFNLLYEKFVKEEENYYKELENASQYLVNSVGVREKYRSFVKENMCKE